jgi:ATP-dependent RNA helicase DDX56/DBP9
MSATLSADVKKLQKEALNRPSLLKLEEGDDGDNDEKDKKLRQLSLRAPLADRFLICYVLLKLRLIQVNFFVCLSLFPSNENNFQGKTVVFVNSVDQGFRLHLFLAAFFIPSLVLNSELPENSRNFILGEFDAGKCPILIATDESHLLPREEEDVGQANEDEDANDDEDDEAEKPNEKKKKRPKKAASKRALDVAEFGVARGFDFKAVANVINFDFPPTAEA